MRPPYVSRSGTPDWDSRPQIQDAEGLVRMRAACNLAARVLRLAGSLVAPGVTTDEIDAAVHEATIAAGAYPSPLSYGEEGPGGCHFGTGVGWLVMSGVVLVMLRLGPGNPIHLAGAPHPPIPNSRPLHHRNIPQECVHIRERVHLPRHPRLPTSARRGHPQHRRHRVLGREDGWEGVGVYEVLSELWFCPAEPASILACASRP